MVHKKPMSPRETGKNFIARFDSMDSLDKKLKSVIKIYSLAKDEIVDELKAGIKEGMVERYTCVMDFKRDDEVKESFNIDEYVERMKQDDDELAQILSKTDGFMLFLIDVVIMNERTLELGSKRCYLGDDRILRIY